MTKYLKYIFAFAFFCNSIFADDIDAGWNNFKNSLLDDLHSMDTGFGMISDIYFGLDNSLSIIINQANNLPSDYSSIKNTIINQANSSKQSASNARGLVNQLRQDVSSMASTVSNMSYPSSSSVGSSSGANITNDLKTVINHLSKIQEYDSYTIAKIQELIQTNRPIRDSISNLLYYVQHSINSTLSSISYYVQSTSNTASSILDDLESSLSTLSSINDSLSTINSNLSSIEYNTRGTTYRLETIKNAFNNFYQSWLNHADHQDNFYSVATNQLHDIIFSLGNLSFSNLNANVDFTPVTGVITNIPEYWEMMFPSINDYTKQRSFYSYFYPEINNQGQVRRIGYNFDLGSQIFPDAFEDGNLHNFTMYNPFIYLMLFSYYNTTALTSLNNWSYLINQKSQTILHGVTNISQKVNSIDATTKNLESHVRDIQVAFSTNNFILGQQLSKLDYIQSLFSNNVPVASLNLDRQQLHSTWYDFFTNFYLNVSLGWDDSGNTPQYSSWQSNTNWFNRIESLLAALVFKDDSSGKVTNVVSTSATESAVSDVTTSLRGVVEIDNSFSQNVSSSANTILDMLTAWTQQITDSAQLKGSFDMFHVPHIDGDVDQSHPQDSPASGDWTFSIGVQDNKFGDFIQFIRSLTTVLWLCVFMFFALKMSLFLLICICKFVYFCYVVFSAMMGGD